MTTGLVVERIGPAASVQDLGRPGWLKAGLSRGGAADRSAFIEGLGLSPLATLLMIIVFYVVLGCFMETFSMLITTAALVTPIVVALGYDPVWFGILLMVLLETALITPPIGINLFVVQSVRGQGQITEVMLGALPFVVTMFALIGLLIAYPSLALWLPKQFY